MAALCLLSAALLLPSGAGAQQLSGYAQVDYLHSAESQDQLADASGQPLNQDRFFLRRARVKAADRFRFAEYALELDANTVSGVQLGLRQAEVALRWTHGGAEAADAAAGLDVRLGAGMFRAPFGHDVYELSSAERLFADPSLLQQAFFPGEFDLGARLSAEYAGLGLVLAAQNGEPIGSRPFPARDPNAAKDLFARFTGRGALSASLRVEGGVSFVFGQGFHPGTPPTKDTLVWRDFNEDGIAQVAEVQAIRGAAGTPSQNFDRWGLAADVRALWANPLGQLTATAEVALGHNLDRGIRPADPVLASADQRSVAAYASLTQELSTWALAGVRVDYYDPALDATQTQGGTLVRSRSPFWNTSVAVGARLGESPTRRGRARVVADYTFRNDLLATDGGGLPADRSNDSLTLRLQLEY